MKNKPYTTLTVRLGPPTSFSVRFPYGNGRQGTTDGANCPKRQDRHALRSLQSGLSGANPIGPPISAGCAIGFYRRGAKGGTWVARFRDEEDGKQHYEALGAADDARDADGLTVFSYSEAQKKARGFFDRKARLLAGHAEPADCRLTVADALDAYFAGREQRGSKGLAKDRAAAQARILPKLGAVEVAKLTTKSIRDWQSALASAPRLTRAPRIAKDRKVRAIDTMDVDAVRARSRNGEPNAHWF